MSIERESSPIDYFNFGGVDQEVEYMETLDVVPGVTCDTYFFEKDSGKDLAIIHIKPGSRTPLQRVVSEAARTIEGHLSGRGKLVVFREELEEPEEYEVDDGVLGHISVDVRVGDVMQWEAAPDSELMVYEVCFPPYQRGRFVNLII